MIYTIISLADVFADDAPCEVITRRVKNGYAEYITVNGREQLRRLISTVPSDYIKTNIF